MAGSLGKIEPPVPVALDMGAKQLTTYQDALTAVQNRGIVLHGPPSSGFQGEMPASITALDDERLGQLLADSDQWCGFLEEELARADAERKDAEAALTFVRARVRIGLKALPKEAIGGKLTVQDKDDMVETDPKVVEATAKALYTQARYQLTKAVRDRAQRNWETVSRRITQRGQAIDRARRDGNVSQVPITSPRGGFKRYP